MRALLGRGDAVMDRDYEIHELEKRALTLDRDAIIQLVSLERHLRKALELADDIMYRCNYCGGKDLDQVRAVVADAIENL